MPNPDVVEIVAEWLKDKGFSGLINPDSECGCPLDDIAPCGEMQGDCEAGYKVMCTPDMCGDRSEDSGCSITECEGFKEGNWIIHRRKEGR